MSDDRPFIPVIFLGNKGAYSLARAIHEQYHIRSEMVVTMEAGPVAHSKILNLHVLPKMNEDVKGTFEHIIEKIDKKYPTQPKIAFGSEDTYVEHLIEYRKMFEDQGWLVPYTDLDTLHAATDKGQFYAMCERLHVPYPKTWTFRNPVLPSDAKGKLIVKPAITPSYQNLHFEGKRKVYYCDNADEAQKAITLMADNGYHDDFIVQEQVEGDDTDQAVVTCYRSPHDGKIKMMCFGHILMEDHSASAAGNHLMILTENGHQEIYQEVKKLVDAYDFNGFSNFDLMYDKKRGKYVFFELNPRLGLSNYYVTAGGQNVAYYYIEDYLYKRHIDPSLESEEALFTVVSKHLAHKKLKDTPYWEKVEELYHSHRAFHPLDYPYDDSWLRKLYVQLSELNYDRKDLQHKI